MWFEIPNIVKLFVIQIYTRLLFIARENIKKNTALLSRTSSILVKRQFQSRNDTFDRRICLYFMFCISITVFLTIIPPELKKKTHNFYTNLYNGNCMYHKCSYFINKIVELIWYDRKKYNSMSLLMSLLIWVLFYYGVACWSQSVL